MPSIPSPDQLNSMLMLQINNGTLREAHLYFISPWVITHAGDNAEGLKKTRQFYVVVNDDLSYHPFIMEFAKSMRPSAFTLADDHSRPLFGCEFLDNRGKMRFAFYASVGRIMSDTGLPDDYGQAAFGDGILRDVHVPLAVRQWFCDYGNKMFEKNIYKI